nr:DUF4257 domain-containing protein [Anaerolineae bacterium]
MQIEPLMDTIWLDLLIAALFGLAGGFGLGLLQENGIELPRTCKKIVKQEGEENKVTFYLDLGFLADMLVGALAALVLYALNQPGNILQLIAVAVTSGLGGAGILKGYVQAQRNQELGSVAQEAINIANMQAAAPPVPEGGTRGPVEDVGGGQPHAQERLDELQGMVDEMTRRGR